MKKLLFLTAVLALFMTTCFGCSAKTAKDAKVAEVANVEENANVAEEPMVLGKLYYVNLKEGEQPIMTGLTLAGNRCGAKEFNNKPAATEGIRAVFELDEWVEFYPETNAGTGIKVMVFKHNADQGFYLKNALNDETPGYIQELDLNKDPDAEENAHWGSFYLHPDEVEPGLYDFVFLYNNKVFATMLTKFYKPEELSEKSDSELEKLMKE